MAYIQDSTQSFTITLTAFLEGIGTLTYIEVINVTAGTYGLWEGSWTAPIPAFTEGDGAEVYVELLNEGATTDDLFAEFVSAQVIPGEPLIQEFPNVTIGSYEGSSWTFTMPPNDVNITINAGHVE